MERTQDVSTSPVVTLVVVQMVFKWRVGNVGTLTSAQRIQLVVHFRSVFFTVWNFQCNLFINSRFASTNLEHMNATVELVLHQSKVPVLISMSVKVKVRNHKLSNIFDEFLR